MAKKEPNYVATFSLAVLITLVIHYFFISRVTMHPTLHVLFSILMLWVVMGIIANFSSKK
ncbi:hypothetical protein KW805_02495 [Candidatus Pacearchaeota archaeon]|nr:hypothetical protein [Candidatus Pacearchaeota archaeon]